MNLDIQSKEILVKAVRKQRFFFFKNNKEMLFDKYSGLIWPNPENYQIRSMDGLKKSKYKTWQLPKDKQIEELTVSGEFYLIQSTIKEGDKLGNNVEIFETIFKLITISNIATSVVYYYPNSKKLIDAGYNSSTHEGEHLLEFFERLNLKPIFLESEANEVFEKAFAATSLVKRAEIKVPELAESITEGTIAIAQWVKKVGDRVEKGEFIVELETDKVNVEIISEEAGILTQITAEEGDTVLVGQIIAIVEVIDSAKAVVVQEESSNESMVSSPGKRKLANLKITDLLPNASQMMEQTSFYGYFHKAKKFLQELQNIVDTIEKEHQSTLCQLNNWHEKLISNRHTENQQLEEFYQIILEGLNVDLSNVKVYLHKMMEDLDSAIEKLQVPCSFDELAQIEQQAKPSLSLMFEHTLMVVNRQIKQLNKLLNKTDAFQSVVSTYEELSAYYSNQLETEKNQVQEWTSDGIEQVRADSWLDHWRIQQIKPTKLIIELTRLILTNKISVEIFIKQYKELQQYQFAIDQLFVKERQAIHHKFAFQTGGEIQEKLDIESNLHTVLMNFQRFALEACELPREQIIIAHLVEPLLDEEIANVIAIVENEHNTLDLLMELQQLRKTQLVNFVVDSKQYIEFQGEREKKYNALMYKMRKELMKR